MEKAAEVLMSGKAIMIYELIVLIALIVFLLVRTRKKRESRERQNIRQTHERNERLEELLSNPEKKDKIKRNADPYQVKYFDHVETETGVQKIQMEITLTSQTSIKKYMFDLPGSITIGRDKSNMLQIESKAVSREQCVIYSENRGMYVKNLSRTNETVLIRGSRGKVLHEEPVKLNDKDTLEMGDIRLSLKMIM